MANDPNQPNAQFGYTPDQAPIEEPEEDVEGMIDETVGEIKPWSEVELALDGWQYRVWDKWLGNEEKTADLLLNQLQQFDPTATMMKEQSKTHPESPDTVYVYRFSLFGNPDGVLDAVTDIQESFLALENYKVIAGAASAIITYADGSNELLEVPTKGGTDIDEALRYVLDAFNKSLGSKGEEGESEDIERQIAELQNEMGQKPWTPSYQSVPKALHDTPAPMEGPIEELEPVPEFGRIREKSRTYAEEMANLIETLIKVTNDPTTTPEAVEQASKVAEDRVDDIVKWAEEQVKKLEDGIDPEADEVLDSLQKILEHGSRIQMLLIGTKEGAKKTGETPLPEPVEPAVEPLESPENTESLIR